MNEAVAALLGALIGAGAGIFGTYWAERRGQKRELLTSARMMRLELAETLTGVRQSAGEQWAERFPVNQDKWMRHEKVLAADLTGGGEWEVFEELRPLVFDARDRHRQRWDTKRGGNGRMDTGDREVLDELEALIPRALRILAAYAHRGRPAAIPGIAPGTGTG